MMTLQDQEQVQSTPEVLRRTAFMPSLVAAPAIGLLVQQVEDRKKAEEEKVRHEAELVLQKQAEQARIEERSRHQARRPYGAD